jgi:hypothetical protein
MSEAQDPPIDEEPQEAPELPRRVHLYGAQWIGLPLLFILPVLALLGVFGEAREEVRAAAGGLELTVDHPSRLRAGQPTELTVRLRNLADRRLDSVSVRWDTAYLHRFARLDLLPGQEGDPPGTVALEPGAEWTVRLELEGGALWSHRGSVAATVRESEVARVRVGTFVFP